MHIQIFTHKLCKFFCYKMKDTVNQRFINLVNYVISGNIAKSKTEIAEKLNFSTGKLSEILNGRNNVGLDMIVGFCEAYNINYEYILTGRGEIYKTEFAEPRNLLDPEAVIDYLILNTEKLLEHRKFKVWYDNIYTKGALDSVTENVKAKYNNLG